MTRPGGTKTDEPADEAASGLPKPRPPATSECDLTWKRALQTKSGHHGLNPRMSVFFKRKDRDYHRHREDVHVDTEAEITGICPHAK